MNYTFSSLIRLPEFNLSRLEEVGRPWLKITRDMVAENTPTNRVFISMAMADGSNFPSWGRWNGFYSEPNGAGKIEVLEIGIKFSPASFTNPGIKDQLEGNIHGLTVLTTREIVQYWIRSNIFSVRKDEVGIYLPSET